MVARFRKPLSYTLANWVSRSPLGICTQLHNSQISRVQCSRLRNLYVKPSVNYLSAITTGVSHVSNDEIIFSVLFPLLITDHSLHADIRNVVHQHRHGHRLRAQNHKNSELVFGSDSTVCRASIRMTTDSMNQSQMTWNMQLPHKLVWPIEMVAAGAAVSLLTESMTTMAAKRRKIDRIPMKSTKMYFARTCNHRIVRSQMKLCCRHHALAHTLAHERTTHWKHRPMWELSRPMVVKLYR